MDRYSIIGSILASVVKMRKGNWGNWSKSRKKQPVKEMSTVEVKVHICKKTYDILEKLRESDDGLPLSRYIQIAIDNELDQDKPFAYNMKFTEEDYVEDKYAHEANVIFEFLKKYSSKGISLMMLMLLRRHVGLMDRERIYRGYHELVRSGVVEEYYCKDGFAFPKWYRKIKIRQRIS